MAESGFSYLTKVLGTNRQNLEPTSMDALLRIMINGPQKLNELNRKNMYLSGLRSMKGWTQIKMLVGDLVNKNRKKYEKQRLQAVLCSRKQT